MRASWCSFLAGALLLPAVVAHADCDPNRMLNSVTQDGTRIELDNGSQWRVDDLDRSTTRDWQQDAPITACSHELINREVHESVNARRIKRGFRIQ